VHTGDPIRFSGVPRFPAEHFARLRLKDARYKQFDDGLRQLEEEGLMQVFFAASGKREPIVGVVGALQFDVIASRLSVEYGAEAQVDTTNYTAARWLADPKLSTANLGGQFTLAMDRLERPVLLFNSPWDLQYFERQHPQVKLLEESPV
jgi:peptide chain release factor 3